MNESLPEWLGHRARTHADHPALCFEATTISFAELSARAGVTAARLRALGVMPGRPQFVELLFAIMRLGAAIVPLNTRLTAAELGRPLRECAPSLLLYEAATAATVRTLPADAARRACVEPGGICGDAVLPGVAVGEGVPPRRVDLSQVHGIIYTSGSSGEPKGALLTHGNHLWSSVGSAFNLGVHPGDRWLACLPLCHVGGLSIPLRSVIYGTAVVLQRRFDPEGVNRAIDEQGVTLVSVVASMLQRMLEARGRRPYPPWLRGVLLGGGPVPRSLLDDCAARRVPVLQTYGLTEAASQATTWPPGGPGGKLGSAGRPLLTAEVRIRAPGGEAAAGEAGEIQVRGPTVGPGYVDGRSRVDAGGWLHTGDVGRVDDDGFLYVLGRQDDRVISGGENIDTAEIEAALLAHPDVAEACVFGVPDPAWGESVAASIRLRPGAAVSLPEIDAHLRLRLAGFKVPRRVRVVDDFPRTASGKISRAQVRAAAVKR